jgi:hypothetical protein
VEVSAGGAEAVDAPRQRIRDLRRSSLAHTPMTARVTAPSGDEGATPEQQVPAIVGAADTDSMAAGATTSAAAGATSPGDAGEVSCSTPALAPVRIGSEATGSRPAAGASASATYSPAGTPRSTRRKRALLRSHFDLCPSVSLLCHCCIRACHCRVCHCSCAPTAICARVWHCCVEESGRCSSSRRVAEGRKYATPCMQDAASCPQASQWTIS